MYLYQSIKYLVLVCILQQIALGGKASVVHKNHHFKVVAHQTFINIFEKDCFTWQLVTQLQTDHRQAITAVAISDDGELIVSGSSDCALNIYCKSSEGLWIKRTQLLLHTDSISSIKIFVDGSISSYSSKETIFWSLNEATSGYDVDCIFRN